MWNPCFTSVNLELVPDYHKRPTSLLCEVDGALHPALPFSMHMVFTSITWEGNGGYHRRCWHISCWFYYYNRSQIYVTKGLKQVNQKTFVEEWADHRKWGAKTLKSHIDSTPPLLFNCHLIHIKDFLFIFGVPFSFSTKLCLNCTIPKATLQYSWQFHIGQQISE